MGGKSSAPAAPDYSGIATADEQASNQQYQLGEQQLAWAQQQYNNEQPMLQQVVGSDVATQQQQDADAQEAQNFYESTYRPLQTDYAQKASAYASPAMQTEQAGLAGEAVDSSFDGQRAQAANRLASMGIDPSQARAGALDSEMATSQAAARAGAENTARINTQLTGLGLEGNAIAQGQGLPGNEVAYTNSGTGAGSAGVGSTNSTISTGSNAATGSTAFTSEGNAANANAAGALTQGYNAALGQFNANQNASSGVGALVGSLAGDALGTGGISSLFSAEGGSIPASASPSGGAQVDDIPARLNAGEFVIPKDVAQFEGHRKLQGLVDSARKKMGLPLGASAATAGQTPADMPPGAMQTSANDPPLGAPMMPSSMGVPMSRPASGGAHQGRTSPMRNLQSVGLPV